MSKVYDYHLEMEELECDAEYQEYLMQQSLTEEDLEEMAKEEVA